MEGNFRGVKLSQIETIKTINAHRELMGSFSVETVVRGFHVGMLLLERNYPAEEMLVILMIPTQ